MTGLRPHHGEKGFTNPWPTCAMPSRGDLLRWRRERLSADLAPDPPPTAFPTVQPEIPNRTGATELIATWIGHSSWLLQIGGLNILTDPQWSERASPISWLGPRRMTPPGVALDRLPPIDVVLISHDHYDHLDEPTVRRLNKRFGDRLSWVTPLGYARWFRHLGIEPIEMDWWERRSLDAAGGTIDLACLPAQHWTSRTPWDRMKRLWCSWSVAGGGRGVFFGGDSGWFPEYQRIGEFAGPLDLTLLPVGAYEPRWFMRSSHMNPEDAVRAFTEIDAGGGAGLMAGMHWGAFRLTDEDPLAPPVALAEAWRKAGLPAERLWNAAIGETRRIGRPGHQPNDGDQLARR